MASTENQDIGSTRGVGRLLHRKTDPESAHPLIHPSAADSAGRATNKKKNLHRGFPFRGLGCSSSSSASPEALVPAESAAASAVRSSADWQGKRAPGKRRGKKNKKATARKGGTHSPPADVADVGDLWCSPGVVFGADASVDCVVAQRRERPHRERAWNMGRGIDEEIISSILDCPFTMDMRRFGPGPLHSGHLRYPRGGYCRSPAEFDDEMMMFQTRVFLGGVDVHDQYKDLPPSLSLSCSLKRSCSLSALVNKISVAMGFPAAPATYQTGQRLLSKIATNGGHGENSSYFDGWKAYETDPFHPTHNPEGVIQMGLAENQLCHDLIQAWITSHPHSSLCTPSGVSDFPAVANFQDYHGLPSFRLALANFMEKVRGGRARFDPDRIVMSGGATGAQETIAFCLADPGDAFLIPTPYYPGFDRDFRWRTGAQLLPVHCDSSNDFKVTAAALESAYENARIANIRVKGVLLTNPSNPLGTSMDRGTLETVLSFINSKRIHLVCDEIFAGTNFARPDFVGVSEIIQDDPAYDRSLVHIVYSLSKVLGLPGFRVGVVYSYNDDVVSCARKMSSFGLVSTQTQHFLASLLSDDAFTTRFLAESARRLSERRRVFTSGLARVGIRCLGSNAGLFCWMDLRPLLKEATADEEIALWRVIVREGKLNVSPGTSFHCSEPGWFRVCFANIDSETMEIALRRIGSLVDRSMNGVRVQAKKRSWQGAGLRLSMGRRRFEDLTIMSPQLMSPRSPLVHAAT